MSTIKPTKLGLINIQLKDTTYLNIQSTCMLLGIVSFEDALSQSDGKIDYVVLHNKITPQSDPSLDIWYKIKSGGDVIFVADEWVATMANIDTDSLVNVKLNIATISEDNLNIVKQLLKTLNIEFSTSINNS